MKKFFDLFSDILKSRPAYFLLLINLFICGFAFDWEQLIFDYEQCESQKIKTVIFSDKISFGCYSFSSSPTQGAMLIGFFHMLSFPATVTAEIYTDNLKKSHPEWCAESFKILYTLIFVFFNSLHWFVVGFSIEFLSANFRIKTKPEENFIKIFT